MSSRSKRKLTWTRREVTERREIEKIEYEQKDDAARIAEEKKNKADEALSLARLVDMETPARPWETDKSNWSPPRTMLDFMSIVDHVFPDWPMHAKIWQAKKMLERHGLVERAYLDGLAMGRTLRERHRYNLGWWWDSLTPLEPQERTLVVEQIKRVILR